MCRQNGWVFCTKSLAKGSIFQEKSPDMGPIFQEKSLAMCQIFKSLQTPDNFENLVCFFGKIAKMGPILEKKKPRYGYLLFEKLPLDMGMGLSCQRHIPGQSKSEYPPPRLRYILNNANVLIHI